MKYTKLVLSAVLFCVFSAGCAKSPDTNLTRVQIDDLRDDDRDGVINQRDLCSQSPENTSVDNQGCTEWQTSLQTEILSVYFDMASHDIRQDQMPTLQRITDYLSDHKEAYVILVGDTSIEGTEEYNQQLAFRRTGAIREQLKARGINTERISEQEYFQITSITEQLKVRERRTIAVITHPRSDYEAAWNIFTSERVIEGNTDENQ